TYCLGEFGELLQSNEELEKAKAIDPKFFEDSPIPFTLVREREIAEFLGQVGMDNGTPVLTKQFTLNACVKLLSKWKGSDDKAKLTNLLSEFEGSVQVELQQRSVEYGVLSSASLDKIRGGILAKMPPPTKKKKSPEPEVKGDPDVDDNGDK